MSREEGAVSEWLISEPGEIVLDAPVDAVTAQLVRGAFSVAVAGGPPRVVVAAHQGDPLLVRHDGGLLSVVHVPGGGPPPAGMIESVIHGVLGMIGGGTRTADVAVLVPGPVGVRARTTSADILISGATDAAADSVSGAVTASAVRSSLEVSSVSGDIAAADVDGRLKVRTVSGDVTIAGARLDELVANTTSGDVVIDADLGAGSHSFRAISGGLALRLDPDAGLDVDATTVSGTLSSALGEAVDVGRPGARHWRVRAGDGRAVLRSHTISGDVSLLARTASVDAV